MGIERERKFHLTDLSSSRIRIKKEYSKIALLAKITSIYYK